MQGTVSFHPIDLEFFDGVIQPLIEGQKINPETYLELALRQRESMARVARYIGTLETLLELYEPPPPIAEGKLWDRVRSRLERFDHRPDPLSVLVRRQVEPDLHLYGRPFFITEGSAERVAGLADEYMGCSDGEEVDSLILDQLLRLDKELGKSVEPDGPEERGSSMSYRNELLGALKEIFDLSQAAATQDRWGPAGGARERADRVLSRELPWRAVLLHSRAIPYWIGENVDGLETICKAAGVTLPDFLTPAWRLLGDACEQYPALRDAMGTELHDDCQVGAFVSPADVPELLQFLSSEGSRIIRIATQHGQGPVCSLLLRKIRECAHFAAKHELGYLEASGIPPMHANVDDELSTARQVVSVAVDTL